MKRIYISLIVLLSFSLSYSQQGPEPQPPKQIVGNAGNQVVIPGIIRIDSSAVLKTNYPDTATLNLGLYMKNMPGAIVKVNDELWMRNTTATAWIPAGGQTLTTQNSNTIALSGVGSFNDPLTGTAIISGQPNNIIQSLSDGFFVPNFVQNGIIFPGYITWVSGYTYDVTTATYVIGGITYVAPETQITLANSDPTFGRFDLPVLNSNSTITVITGTAADDPQIPGYDPLTQIPLAPIFVTAASTAPTVTQEWIYINNAEWTTAPSNARINAASTSNPYSAPLDVEWTLARNGDFIRFTDPSPPTTMSDYKVVTFKIRSKGVFNATSRLELRWWSTVTAVGNPLGISDGVYGFNSSNTTDYQTITIPLFAFGALTTTTSFTIAAVTSDGNTIGVYIDDIQLQGGDGTLIPVTGSFHAQGGNSYGAPFVVGSNDNFRYDVKTNNVVRMSISTASITDFRATNGTTSIVSIGPNNGGQLIIGSNTATTPALIINHQSGGGRYGNITFQDNGVQQGFFQQLGTNSIISNFDTQVWRATNAVTEYGRINSSGEFLINETDAGDFKLQVEGGVRLDATSKNITLVGLATDNTATQVLGINGSGNSVWRDVSTITGSAITANNGLTMSTATNAQLGGTLLASTTIDMNSRNLNFTLSTGGDFNVATLGVTLNIDEIVDISGTSTTSLVNITNTSATSTSKAITITAGNGIAFEATSAGPGVTAHVKQSPIADGAAEFSILQLTRSAGVAGTNDISGSLDFFIKTSTSDALSNQIVSKLTDATHATRTSQLIIRGVNSAVTADLFTLSGSGSLQLNKYGVNTFAGVAAYVLGVDASGNVVEVAAAGAGMTNVLTTTGDIIYSSSGSTPARLGVASNGDVLTLVAGIPAWVTPGVGGTVTSVTGTSNRITITGTPTVAPVIDIAATYVGQASITTLGTIGTGVWQGTSIGTAFTDANIITVTGTSNRLTIGGTSTDPTFDISTSYVGQATITTLGTIATGVWQGTAIATTYAGTPTGGTVGQVLVKNSSTNYDYSWSSAGAGTVTNVTGTSNRITVATGTTTPLIDISSNYIGQGTITTLGTITSGTWNGSTIAVARGGTGLTSATSGRVLVGNGTSWTEATPTGSNGITFTMGAGTMNASNVFNPTPQTLTFGSPIVWNVTNGGNAKVTLTGTGATLSITNPVAGYTYTVEITQGSGGSKTITTWPTGTTWSGPNTLSTTAGVTDLVVMYYNGTNYRSVMSLNYN